MTFAQDFELVCAYSKLSDAERDAAWLNVHRKPGAPLAKAVRNFRAIAASLSVEELQRARSSAGILADGSA